MEERINLSPPSLTGEEFRYLFDAFKTNWIAPLGPQVDGFEQDICTLTGAKSAAALASGSAAIFLSLKALGVGAGDTVLCSDLTFAGSCFPAALLGARPVFIDSDPQTCNMSPEALERALDTLQKEDCPPKAVIIVDLYGNPADYGRLLPLCEAYGVPVLNDAAEALGTRYRGRHCGTFGRIGVFSFNGNKIITTSGGGMALSDDPDLTAKIKFWATQAREPCLHYEHREVGYNFRLSGVCAAIGRGQLTGLASKIQKRAHIQAQYRRGLEGCPVRFVEPTPGGEPNHWLTGMLLDAGASVTPAAVIGALARENIEARPFWKPMHAQPVFRQAAFFAHGARSVSDDLFARGVCLPTGDTLTDAQLERIIGVVRGVLTT